jgi:hypothetical protein
VVFSHEKPDTADAEPLFAGARLAGEGVLKSAFAGKPGSYMSDLSLTDLHQALAGSF